MPTDELSNPSTSARAAFEVGQKLAGIYILRDQISDRSEGEIWLAHDEVLGKDVSLHFIPDLLRGDARAMGEIRQEIKRNRQLIHPGILRVYDLVEEPDWSAISMDWFEGESLGTALKNRPGGFFEPADVKPWLQQVCQTLDDIHKIQIVHRDIAPHNIFVDSRGKVLLAKFGISRVIEDALARLNKEGGPDARLASISPQCLDGEHPSKADDIYSIGATIYELLTGALPFSGPDLLAQIRKNPPQPMMERRAKLGKRGGTILPVWEKWVFAALAKATTDRPASAGELAAKLGLSGKLSVEAAAPVPAPAPVLTPTPAAAAAVPPAAAAAVPLAAAAAAAAPAPASATASEKKTETPKEAPAAPETPAANASTTVPAVEPNHANAHPPESAPESKPVAPVESRIELPARGPGIKLPPSRLAGVAAAESERKTVETPVEKPLALEDDDDDADSKHDTDRESDPYEDRPPSAKSSALVFGGLILLVAALAYLLNRPAKQEAQPVTGTPVNAQVTPAPAASTPKKTIAEATPRVDATTQPRLGDEPILAPAPPVATATPTVPSATPPVRPAPPGNDPLVAATDDPEKEYLNALKREESARAAVAEAQKAVGTKEKEITPMVKAGAPLLAQRTKRAEEVKAAEDAAEAARQAAEAKAKAVEDARKAQAEWEAANAAKLAAYDKATADFTALQQALAEKREQADAAARDLVAANKARQDLSALRRKEKEEADRLAARQAEEKRLEEETKAAKARQVDDEIANVKRTLDILIFQREHPGEPLPASLAAPGPRTPPAATPAITRPAVTPGPVNSTPRGIPSPPPSPRPVPTSRVQGEFMEPGVPVVPATPPTTTVLLTPTPPVKVIPSSPPPVATPATPPPIHQATATPAPPEPMPGENSLGLKFAQVGDVAFCIWPTRLQDFDVFAKETGFRNNAWKSPGFRQGPDHPVVNVSWSDAMAFCKWLTDRDRKKGFLTKDQIYRLPTDLEWSKAVGLPDETGKSPEARDMSVPDVFPWGTQWPPPPNVGNYTGEETGSDVAIRGYDDGFAWTSPVGTFNANKYGLHDIGGNVWQWCMDNWSAESKAKVLRGASWYNGALKLSLLSSCRVSANPDLSTDNYGFRIVRATESKGGRPR